MLALAFWKGVADCCRARLSVETQWAVLGLPYRGRRRSWACFSLTARLYPGTKARLLLKIEFSVSGACPSVDNASRFAITRLVQGACLVLFEIM